jgi:hypothetical protein
VELHRSFIHPNPLSELHYGRQNYCHPHRSVDHWLLNAVLWGVLVGTRGLAGNVAGLVINVVLALFLISGQGGHVGSRLLVVVWGPSSPLPPGHSWGI